MSEFKEWYSLYLTKTTGLDPKLEEMAQEAWDAGFTNGKEEYDRGHNDGYDSGVADG